MDSNLQPQENNTEPKSKLETLIDRIYGERKTLLQKLLTISSVIFFVLVPIELIINIIYGIYYLSSVTSNYVNDAAIMTIVSSFLKVITSPIMYAFYGLVLAVLKRITTE